MDKFRFPRLFVLMVFCCFGLSDASLHRCEQRSPFTFSAAGQEFIVNDVTLDSSAHTIDESHIGHFEVRVHAAQGDAGVLCVRYDQVMKENKQTFPCAGGKPIIGKLLEIRSLKKDKPVLTPLCNVIVGGGLFKGCPKDATVVDGRCQCKAGTTMVANSCVIQSVTVIDGGWSLWSAWSPCSSRCGPGQKTRSRTCDKPETGPGGQPCTGPNSSTAGCDSVPCSSPTGEDVTRTEGHMGYKMKVNCNSGSIIQEQSMPKSKSRPACVNACLKEERCQFAVYHHKKRKCTLRDQKCRGSELTEDAKFHTSFWQVGPNESCDPGEICDHHPICYGDIRNQRKRS